MCFIYLFMYNYNFVYLHISDSRVLNWIGCINRGCGNNIDGSYNKSPELHCSCDLQWPHCRSPLNTRSCDEYGLYESPKTSHLSYLFVRNGIECWYCFICGIVTFICPNSLLQEKKNEWQKCRSSNCQVCTQVNPFSVWYNDTMKILTYSHFLAVNV